MQNLIKNLKKQVVCCSVSWKKIIRIRCRWHSKYVGCFFNSFIFYKMKAVKEYKVFLDFTNLLHAITV